MTDAQKIKIKEYVLLFDTSITNSAYLDLVVDTVADRVLLYLNTLTLDPALNRIVAQVVVSNYMQIARQHEQSLATVSDNGQTVSYFVTQRNYFGSKADSELFSGFEKLLAGHRRIHVITS